MRSRNSSPSSVSLSHSQLVLRMGTPSCRITRTARDALVGPAFFLLIDSSSGDQSLAQLSAEPRRKPRCALAVLAAACCAALDRRPQRFDAWRNQLLGSKSATFHGIFAQSRTALQVERAAAV